MADSIRDHAYRRDVQRTTETQQPQRAATSRERFDSVTSEPHTRSLRFREATRPTDPERPTIAGQLAQGRRESIGEFQKGIENTTRMLAQSGSATAAMVAGSLGFEDTAVNIQRRSEQADEARGPQHNPRMADVRDIRSAGDFGDYMAHLAGSQLPIVAAIIGTAGLGGKAAVAGKTASKLKSMRAAALAQGVRANTQAGQQAGLKAAQAISRRLDVRGQVGSALGSVAAITGVTAPGQAELLTDEDASGSVQARAIGGLASAGLGGVVGILPVHRFLGSAGFNRRVAHDSARIKKAMGNPEQSTLLGKIAREVPIQAGMGGVIEVMQEASLRVAHAHFKENVGMFDEEAVGMYLNAGVASVIISGFLGGLGPTMQHATQKTLATKDTITQFSDDMAKRVDDQVRKRMRAAILGNPTKTSEFRRVRAIDEELAQSGVTEELRSELALIVGPEYVDTIIEGARQENMSVEDFLQRNLEDSETRDNPEFTIIASKITNPDPEQRIEAGLANMIGQDVLEFAPDNLKQALSQMPEGQRHDTVMLIGELSQAVRDISEDSTSITGDDVTQFRNQLGRLIGDENIESAIEVALRRELQHNELMARLEDGDTQSGDLRSDMLAGMMDRTLSAEELAEMRNQGMEEAAGPPAIKAVGQALTDKALSKGTQLKAPALQDVIPFQRTAAEGEALPKVSAGAQRAAARATQNTGLEHTVSRAGDVMREAGATDAELIAEANRLIAEAKARDDGAKWLKKMRNKRSAKGALDVLNRLDVVRMTDEAAALDQQIAAEGGFSAEQLSTMVKDPDVSGLPRDDQVLMKNPEGRVVAVDLVTANRIATRNRRGRPADETQVESATAALGMMMERGYRALTKAEVRERVKAAEGKVTQLRNKPAAKLARQQIDDFLERGSPEMLNEFNVVNRRSARKGMTLEEAFSGDFHAEFGLDAPVGKQRIDADFLLDIARDLDTRADRLSKVGESALEATAQPEVIGPQLLSQALDLVANGDLEAGQQVLRSMRNAERTAAETAYNEIRRSMSDTVDQAAVRAGEVLFGKETAQLRRDTARNKLARDQEKMRKRAREAPTKAAKEVLEKTLEDLPADQRHRAAALQEALSGFELIEQGKAQEFSARMQQWYDGRFGDSFEKRDYYFGRQVMMEMYIARMQVISEQHRASLKNKMPDSLREMEQRMLDAVDLSMRMVEHKINEVRESAWKVGNRAEGGEAVKLQAEIAKLSSKFEDVTDQEGYLKLFVENGNWDGVYKNLSPGVEGKLTLFDYVLFEQAQQRNDGAGYEIMASDPESSASIEATLAGLQQAERSYKAYQRMLRDFALLQQHTRAARRKLSIAIDSAFKASGIADTRPHAKSFFREAQDFLQQKFDALQQRDQQRIDIRRSEEQQQRRAERGSGTKARLGSRDSPVSLRKPKSLKAQQIIDGKRVKARLKVPEGLKLPGDTDAKTMFFTFPGVTGTFEITKAGPANKNGERVVTWRAVDTFRNMSDADQVTEQSTIELSENYLRNPQTDIVSIAQRVLALQAQGKHKEATRRLRDYAIARAAKRNPNSAKARQQAAQRIEQAVLSEISNARNEAQTKVFVDTLVRQLRFPEGYPVPRQLFRAIATAARTREAVIAAEPKKMTAEQLNQSVGVRITEKLLKDYRKALKYERDIVAQAAEMYREQFLDTGDAQAQIIRSGMQKWVSDSNQTKLDEVLAARLSTAWERAHALQAKLIRATDAQLAGKDRNFTNEVVAEFDALLKEGAALDNNVELDFDADAWLSDFALDMEKLQAQSMVGSIPLADMFSHAAYLKLGFGDVLVRGRVDAKQIPPIYQRDAGAKRQKAQSLANELLQPYRLKVKVFSSAQDIRDLINSGELDSKFGHLVHAFSRPSVLMKGGVLSLVRSIGEIAGGTHPGALRLKNGELLMFISPLMSESEVAFTTLHETGHLIEMEIFSRADEKTQKAIFDEFEQWLKRVGKEHYFSRSLRMSQRDKKGLLAAAMESYHGFSDSTSTKGRAARDIEYALAFREYFADRFANWASSNKKAQNLVDRFFDGLVKMWNRLLEIFKSNESQFPITPLVDQWFDNAMFNMSPFERLKLMNEPRKASWWEYASNQGDMHTAVDPLVGTIASRVGRTSREESFKTIASSMSHTMEPGTYNQNFGLRHMIEVQLTAEERNTLARVFNQNQMRQQIISFVADDPAWVFEIEKHQDALIATGFQLWEAGALDISPRAAGIFRTLDKFMTEQVFGEVLKSDQVTDILTAMRDGVMRQRESVFNDPTVAKEGSHLQRGHYGLTHAELRYLEESFSTVNANADIPVDSILSGLENAAKFKHWDDVQLRMLARDLYDGVYTDTLFSKATDLPTWAINPDGHFKLKKTLFDSTWHQAARGLKHYTGLLGERIGRLFFGQMMRSRHTGNQGLIDAMNTLYHDVAGSRIRPSYDQTKTMGIARYTSQYESILSPLTEAQKKKFRDAVFEGKPITKADGYDPEVVLATKQYQKLMQNLRQHAISAGLSMGDLGAGGQRIFAPWVFSEEAFRKKGDKFLGFATQDKYMKDWARLMRERGVDPATKENPKKTKFTRKEVENFVQHYIHGLANQDGFADSDVLVDPTKQTQPHARTMFKRELDFLWRAGDEADRKTIAGFLDPNLNTTMAVYINQIIKRSTFNEFFGMGKQQDFEANIISQGGSFEDIQFFRDAIDMQMGTYGLEINPTLQNTIARVGSWFGKDWSNLDAETYREVQGYIVTYQNVRLLAFAALTNVVDMAGIYVRSGDLNMAFQGLRMGMRAARKNATDADLVALREQADMLGVSERIVVQDALGQLYGGVHFTGTAAKINDMFFKYNGMVALNRWLRLSALGTARIYLKKHAALASKNNKKSKTNLLDLGLQPDDIQLTEAGDVKLLSDEEVLALGQEMRPLEIERNLLGQEEMRTASKEVWEQQNNFREVLRDQRVKDALFRFVDEAVMRPSAMQRPSWGNDPNWGVFFHLKAFMYTYHERHLRRGLNKMLSEGDAGPIMMMGSFVGLMMVADMVRELGQFGPEGDDRKKDWTFGDYLWDGTHRSGVLGVGTVLPDMAKTMELRSYQDPVTKYTSPAIEFGGPAVSQLDQLVRAGFGQRRERAVLDAMPANNIWRALRNYGMTGPTSMSNENATRAVLDARFAPEKVREQARAELEARGELKRESPRQPVNMGDDGRLKFNVDSKRGSSYKDLVGSDGKIHELDLDLGQVRELRKMLKDSSMSEGAKRAADQRLRFLETVQVRKASYEAVLDSRYASSKVRIKARRALDDLNEAIEKSK